MRGYAGSERRQFPRIACILQTDYSPLGLIGSCDHSRTINISLGGVLLRTGDSFKKSQPLVLIIRLPHNQTAVTIMSEVVWQKRIPNSVMNEIGIKFLQLDSALNQFIEDKLR